MCRDRGGREHGASAHINTHNQKSHYYLQVEGKEQTAPLHAQIKHDVYVLRATQKEKTRRGVLHIFRYLHIDEKHATPVYAHVHKSTVMLSYACRYAEIEGKEYTHICPHVSHYKQMERKEYDIHMYMYINQESYMYMCRRKRRGIHTYKHTHTHARQVEKKSCVRTCVYR